MASAYQLEVRRRVDAAGAGVAAYLSAVLRERPLQAAVADAKLAEARCLGPQGADCCLELVLFSTGCCVFRTAYFPARLLATLAAAAPGGRDADAFLAHCTDASQRGEPRTPRDVLRFAAGAMLHTDAAQVLEAALLALAGCGFLLCGPEPSAQDADALARERRVVYALVFGALERLARFSLFAHMDDPAVCAAALTLVARWRWHASSGGMLADPAICKEFVLVAADVMAAHSCFIVVHDAGVAALYALLHGPANGTSPLSALPSHLNEWLLDGTLARAAAALLDTARRGASARAATPMTRLLPAAATVCAWLVLWAIRSVPPAVHPGHAAFCAAFVPVAEYALDVAAMVMEPRGDGADDAATSALPSAVAQLCGCPTGVMLLEDAPGGAVRLARAVAMVALQLERIDERAAIGAVDALFRAEELSAEAAASDVTHLDVPALDEAPYGGSLVRALMAERDALDTRIAYLRKTGKAPAHDHEI